jgi:hypothetical protein
MIYLFWLLVQLSKMIRKLSKKIGTALFADTDIHFQIYTESRMSVAQLFIFLLFDLQTISIFFFFLNYSSVFTFIFFLFHFFFVVLIDQMSINYMVILMLDPLKMKEKTENQYQIMNRVIDSRTPKVCCIFLNFSPSNEVSSKSNFGNHNLYLQYNVFIFIIIYFYFSFELSTMSNLH